MSDDHEKAQRLLAHIFAPETRWSRLSGRLLDFGRRGVPEHRDSRNPIKWLAGEVGTWMSDVRTRRINRRFDQERRDIPPAQSGGQAVDSDG